MTWEQQIQALKALGECSLKMRFPGDWYVSLLGVSRVEGAMLSGSGTRGKNPEEAVENYWAWATDPHHHLRVSPSRNVTWNGFMWADVNG